MLKFLGLNNIEDLISKTVPADIRLQSDMKLGPGRGEHELLQELKQIMSQNKRLRSFIGMGYNGTITPPVILRNLIENPAWFVNIALYPYN
jgi:glycine dehydrogenase